MFRASIFFFLATYFFAQVASAHWVYHREGTEMPTSGYNDDEEAETPTTSDGEYDDIDERRVPNYYDCWEMGLSHPCSTNLQVLNREPEMTFIIQNNQSIYINETNSLNREPGLWDILFLLAEAFGKITIVLAVFVSIGGLICLKHSLETK